RGEVLALADGEVVDAELQVVGGPARAVGGAGLEVGDPAAALGDRTDPVDHAVDDRALELEVEPVLGGVGGKRAVPLEPVGDEHLDRMPTLGLRDGVRREARGLPSLLEGRDERLRRALDLPALAALDELVDEPADPGLVAAARIEPELVGEHVLELAVLEMVQARVREEE